jgi:ADP-ribosyl-[dinitrogen reductase] hydrolase
MDERTRARGILLGLACGDALGRPVEFSSPGAIEQRHGRVTEMLADGTHGQPAGTITDDTEMALCIARSLADNGEFDPADIAARFVEWKQSGPFDIGIMTSNALRRIETGESWDEAGYNEWEASPEGSNAGNGSLMRCAPYAVAYRNDPETRRAVSRESSAITHADPRCRWGCVLFNDVLAETIAGDDRPLETALDALDDLPEEIETAATAVLAYRDGETDSVDLQNSGYVVTTLQAGLYHGLTATSAEETIVDAVMMGGDTDTIAAVTGALAGARFGVEALPERWLSELAVRDELESLADGLFDFGHEQG